MQPFPHHNDATHKIWSRFATWLQRFVQKWSFCHSRSSYSKMSALIRPKLNSTKLFMPVLVTSNFDDDSIKNEQASMETPFSHYKSMGNFLDLKAANSVVSGPIWPKFVLVRDFMHFSLPASIKRIGSKTTEKRWRHCFSHYKSMGAFCCHGNQRFDPICPQNLMQPLPPHATHKIWSRLANWLQRYSSLKVWTTRTMTTDHWYTIISPCESSAQVC